MQAWGIYICVRDVRVQGRVRYVEGKKVLRCIWLDNEAFALVIEKKVISVL